MPTVAYTNNTTNTNGGPVDRIVSGCQEVWIGEQSPTVNNFGSADLEASADIGNAKNLLIRAFGMFKDLPVGATINSATLYLNGNAIGFGDFNVSSHPCLRDWWTSETIWGDGSRLTDSVNFNEAWTTFGGTGVGDIGASTDTNLVNAGGWWSWDVTSIIQTFANDRNTNGIFMECSGGSNGFRFFERSLPAVTDGDRWEIIVDYTGGTPVTLPGQGQLYDFTGDNGDPIPVDFTEYEGTFDIQSNALNCVTVGGGIGGIVGLDTGSRDGTYNCTYVPNGSNGGDAVGPFIRAFDSGSLIDIVQVGAIGAGVFRMILVRDDATITQLGSDFNIPTYDGVTEIPMVIRLDWDRIEVDINGTVNAITVDDAPFYHLETIFGGKFGSISGARLDSMQFPSLSSAGFGGAVKSLKIGIGISL